MTIFSSTSLIFTIFGDINGMKKVIIYIVSLLFMFTISQGCIKAQTKMRIPLKQGYDSNPSVQIGDLTIDLVNLFIRQEPWDGRNLSLQLEMKIKNQTGEHRTFLGYYEKTDDQLRNNFPKAFDRYLFGLDIRDDGVDLLIDTLKFGDEFIIDLKIDRSFTVEDLTLTYKFGSSGNLIGPDHRYAGYDITHMFNVSDGVSEGIIDFEYVYHNGTIENDGTKEWKDYKIEILDDFREPLKLRVTKIE